MKKIKTLLSLETKHGFNNDYLEPVSCVIAPRRKTDAPRNQNIIDVELDVDGIQYPKVLNRTTASVKSLVLDINVH